MRAARWNSPAFHVKAGRMDSILTRVPCLLLLVCLSGCASVPLEKEPLPASSTEAESAGCRFRSGRICPVGAICADDEGCNYCRCRGDGLECTIVGCTRRTAQACQSRSQCGSGGSQCLFDQGCGTKSKGWCIAAFCESHSGPLQAWCGCDGKTFMAYCPERPYAHLGSCP